MTSDDIYRELQRHLDEMPVGYPRTESGVEIRILKHLFRFMVKYKVFFRVGRRPV